MKTLKPPQKFGFLKLFEIFSLLLFLDLFKLFWRLSEPFYIFFDRKQEWNMKLIFVPESMYNRWEKSGSKIGMEWWWRKPEIFEDFLASLQAHVGHSHVLLSVCCLVSFQHKTHLLLTHIRYLGWFTYFPTQVDFKFLSYSDATAFFWGNFQAIN